MYEKKHDRNADQTAAETAINSTVALASVGIVAVKTMEAVLPSAAGDVEKASRDLAARFISLAQDVSVQNDLVQRMLTLLATYGVDKAQWEMLDKQAIAVSRSIDDAICGMVVDMQFQDRNTQMMENAAGIMCSYGRMLEDVLDNVEIAREHNDMVGSRIAEAVESIMSSIRVNEIRAQFMQSLAKAKLLYEETGDAAQTKSGEHNTVELF